MTRLPDLAWLKRTGAKAILAALDGGETTRIVGGAVRDSLLGLPVSDVDLATRLAPEEVVRRLEAAGIKAVPTGIAHGTVTAVAHGDVVEVTTLRRDVSTDGRHATVAFTDDWRADAARRDFTINALYADPATREIADFFGGLDDLPLRRVRFIGDPRQRIAEDHLRILRFFRFHARFGIGAPDAEGYAACRARANDLMALSRERVRDEVLKLLAVADPVPTLLAMFDGGIFTPVVPELDAGRLPDLTRLIAAETAAREPASALRRLAALLPPDAALLDGLAARLRLSNLQRKSLVAMAVRLDRVPSDPRPLAYRAGREGAIDALLLADAPSGTIRALDGWERPKLPISGRDLIAMGLKPGPAVAAALAAVERRWVDDGATGDR
ncbi:MAG: CCA tRNA nucleotidyltransferase [Alphaproteobacteria bacterium]|nr:CCA tRNA nucleotidyltransferase [Alphaproteobacteria bacterium]